MARLNPRKVTPPEARVLMSVGRYKKQLKATFEMAAEEALRKKSSVAAVATLRVWAEEELRDRRFRVTDEDREAVARLRGEGWSVYAISDRVGLSQPTVRKMLKRIVSTGKRPRSKT